jgi:hypothetical protein
MPQKLFLYDSDVASRDLLDYFKRKDYTSLALTPDPNFFWQQVASVGRNGFLAIMSHGNNKTFEIARGYPPVDMPANRVVQFGEDLQQRGVTLYLLSCHTGLDPLGQSLLSTRCLLAAPKGYAEVRSSVATVGVYSLVDPGAGTVRYAGWSGTEGVIPNRDTTPLNIR